MADFERQLIKMVNAVLDGQMPTQTQVLEILRSYYVGENAAAGVDSIEPVSGSPTDTGQLFSQRKRTDHGHSFTLREHANNMLRLLPKNDCIHEWTEISDEFAATESVKICVQCGVYWDFAYSKPAFMNDPAYREPPEKGTVEYRIYQLYMKGHPVKGPNGIHGKLQHEGTPVTQEVIYQWIYGWRCYEWFDESKRKPYYARFPEPGTLERRVIDLYFKNPKTSVGNVSKALGLSYSKTKSIISRGMEHGWFEELSKHAGARSNPPEPDPMEIL